MDTDAANRRTVIIETVKTRTDSSVPSTGCSQGEQLSEVARCLLGRHLRRARLSGHPVLAELRLDKADRDPGELGGFSELVLDEDTEIVGFTALAQSDAVGVVATGSVRSLDPSVEPHASLAASCAGRVDLACVVSRDGHVGWFAAVGSKPAGLPVPSEGRLLDCLRRAVGVPTPPPAGWPSVLQAPLWVANIGELANCRRHPLSWSEVIQVLPDLPSDWYRPSKQDEAPGSAVNAWELLRIDATKERVSLERLSPSLLRPWLPSPAVAAWMDAGVLSRWVKDLIPPAHALAASVTAALTASASRRLGHSLTAILAS